MNLRDLIYFKAVAELGHFGLAAKKCHVSQPTLSMQIQKLEGELGVQLFDRSQKKVSITRVGLAILAEAKQILEHADQIRLRAKLEQDPLAGEVRLGFFPTIAPYILPHIMPAIRKTYPKLQVILVEEKTDTLIARMEAGELDAACLALPVTQRALKALPLFKEPFMLASSSTHSLARKKQISTKDLLNENILLLDEGHCLREQTLEVCSRIGVGESEQFRATSLETLRHMAASGLGITFIPKLATQSTYQGLSYTPFSKPEPFREIGLVFRSTHPRIMLFNALQALIIDRVGAQIAS